MITQMIIRVSVLLHHFQSRKGQSLAEYALILSFVSVLSVALMSVLGQQLRGVCAAIMSALAAARSAF